MVSSYRKSFLMEVTCVCLLQHRPQRSSSLSVLIVSELSSRLSDQFISCCFLTTLLLMMVVLKGN